MIPLGIDPTDTRPPYEQLRLQIAAAITAGTLETGTRLPTVRQLAGDLGIAPGTVMRTYKELAEAGLVISQRAGGTRVASGRVRNEPSEVLADLTRGYVQRARALGASAEIIREAVEAELKE